MTLVLALLALWGLKPWEADSADPHLAPLDLEAAVGEGRALPSAPAAFVAAGVVAPAGPKLVVQPAEQASGDLGTAPALAVAPAQAVAFAEVPSSPTGPAPESGAGDEVPSGGATTVEAPPEGTSSPVTTPASAGGGVPGGPTTAGVGPALESCEGDEYLLAITFPDEESAGGESRVDIVLERFNEDGTSDELQLEGDLNDARSLASMLDSEGNCVQVEIAQPEEGEGAEGAEEVPQVSEEAAGSPEPPAPALP